MSIEKTSLSVEDAAGRREPRPPRRLRWILAACALIIAVPIAAISAAALLVPSEAIARAAAHRAEAALGVPVSIGNVEFDLWPTLSVVLTQARLGHEAAPVAQVDRILLRPRLLPLFSGSVAVREIVFDRPDMRLMIDSAGALNLPFKSGGENQPSNGSTVDFAIDEFRIRDGNLTYADARDGTDLRLGGVQQRLRIDGRMTTEGLGWIGLVGTLSSDSVNADLPGRLGAPVRGVQFRVTHAAKLDREADRLELESLRLEVQRVALEGGGTIAFVSDSLRRSIALELRTDEFSFDDLARSIPGGFLPALLAGREEDGRSARSGTDSVEVDYAGKARIEARITGPLTPDSLPRVVGAVRLSEVAAGLRGQPVLMGTSGVVAFSNQALESRELAGRLFGEPFAMSFRVDDFAAPLATFAAKGTARAEELLVFARMDDSLSASGSIPFDLRGSLVTADPARSSVQGTVGLQGIRISLPSLLQPIELESGRLRFAGAELRAENVAATFGESRLRANAVVDRWLAVAMGDSTQLPVIGFDVRAGVLDLDALLGPSESEYTPLLFARLADRTVNGRSAGEAAGEMGLGLPELPNLHATGTLTADRLVRNGIAYQDLELQLESSPGAVSAPRTRFGLMGGTVELGVGLERRVDDASLTVVYRLENVGAGDFFSRFSPFEGHLTGQLALEGEASLELDRQFLPVRPTVRSSGKMSLTSGALANWPVLRVIGDKLGVTSFDTLSFREWSGDFQIAGPLVSLERSVQLSEGVTTELAGSFDFGGKLDLGVVARLSPELLEGAAEPIRVAVTAAAGGGEGRVPVGLRITGTTRGPNITLDLSAARDNAIVQARERAVEEAESVARRAAAEVTRRALGDSVATTPDSIGDVLRSRVQDRLRGLFGGDRAPASEPSVDSVDESKSEAGFEETAGG